MGNRVHPLLCQLELLFYIWIYALPEFLMIVFPSSVDEERRDWSATKQLCYECALNPVLAIPSVFKPLVVTFFEKVSHAIPVDFWKRHVVDKLKTLLDAFVFIKLLSGDRRDSIVDVCTNFHSLVLPAMTMFSPGFITRWGVMYVQVGAINRTCDQSGCRMDVEILFKIVEPCFAYQNNGFFFAWLSRTLCHWPTLSGHLTTHANTASVSCI